MLAVWRHLRHRFSADEGARTPAVRWKVKLRWRSSPLVRECGCSSVRWYFSHWLESRHERVCPATTTPLLADCICVSNRSHGKARAPREGITREKELKGAQEGKKITHTLLPVFYSSYLPCSCFVSSFSVSSSASKLPSQSGQSERRGDALSACRRRRTISHTGCHRPLHPPTTSDHVVPPRSRPLAGLRRVEGDAAVSANAAGGPQRTEHRGR